CTVQIEDARNSTLHSKLGDTRMLLNVVTLSGCQRTSARLTTGMNQVDIQETAYLSIEVNPATLDAASEQCTLTYRENSPCQSQTVRMDEAPNAHAVAYFDLCHDSLFRTSVGRHRKLSARRRSQTKHFLPVSTVYDSVENFDCGTGRS